ncbi:MAG: right-handed parallel beta-helix repeat-containing protein [Spirochaetes bacterium]|nr:right-handed parallel beta-helix repeat-containing protein [Spirochaetota bacterium]
MRLGKLILILSTLLLVSTIGYISCTSEPGRDESETGSSGGGGGVDTTAPTVTIIFPTNNSYTSNVLTVIGTASDTGSGVREVYLRLSNTGGFGKVSGTTSWTTNLVGLSEGTNTIYVYAVDNSGNTSSTQSVTFIVSIYVSVNILTPTNNQAFNANNVSVSGTANSYSGVNSVYLRVGNTGGFGRVNGTSSWNTNLTGLGGGTNTIYVYAVDNAGNTSSTQSVSFVIQLGSSVGISDPTNNQIINSTSITVSGTAHSYSSTVSGVFLRLGDSGGFGQVNGTDNWTTNLTSLNEGVNTIYVYSIDNAGNTSSTQSVSFIVALRMYVSTNGNDSNNGVSKTSPVRNIQTAVSRARIYNVNEIYTTTGLYRPTSGGGLVNETGFIGDSGVLITNNNIRIIGGWDANFNNIIGYSELDGENILYHILFITNATNIVIKNLVIRKGNANYSSFPHSVGGGIYLDNVSYSLISNVVISNNSASSRGGGIYIASSHSNIIIANIFSNRVVNYEGGGIYLSYSHSNLISGSVYYNSASGNQPSSLGGGIYLYSSSENLIASSVYSNYSTRGGGGIYMYYSHTNIIASNVYANLSSNDGGGIYLYYSHNNTISGNVFNNTAATNGGGIYLLVADNNTISGNVYSNESIQGGGIFLQQSDLNNITSTVYNNRAKFTGGGINLSSSRNNTINGIIHNNYANFSGGGITLDYSHSNSISGTIFSNSTTNCGGGIYINSSHTNSLSGSVYQNITETGGGIYISSCNYITIVGSVYNNIATNHGGGLSIVLASNVSLLNSYITNNWTLSSTNSVIYLHEYQSKLKNLIISNCFIGGNNDTTAIGIYEENEDITGHKLVNNTFITNRLKYLYREYTGNILITNNIDWTNINNPLQIDSTPDSTNNTVANM